MAPQASRWRPAEGARRIEGLGWQPWRPEEARSHGPRHIRSLEATTAGAAAAAARIGTSSRRRRGSTSEVICNQKTDAKTCALTFDDGYEVPDGLLQEKASGRPSWKPRFG